MRTKILLLIFVLTSYHPAMTQATAPPPSHGGEMKNETVKPKNCIGYLVATTSKAEGLKITRTIELADVYALAELHFPNNCVDFTKELRHSVYYEIESQHKGFYVEVKKISRNGKFRRMSNREFRVQSSGFRVQSSEFKVQSSEFKVQSYVGQN